MSFVIATKSVTKYISNGKTQKIVKGNKYHKNSQKYKLFGASCFTSMSSYRNPPLNYDQAFYLVNNCYCAYSNLEDQIKSFTKKYPNFSHSGIECQIRIIAGCDNTRDDKGLDNPGKALRNAMITVDSKRFGSYVPLQIDEIVEEIQTSFSTTLPRHLL